MNIMKNSNFFLEIKLLRLEVSRWSPTGPKCPLIPTIPPSLWQSRCAAGKNGCWLQMFNSLMPLLKESTNGSYTKCVHCYFSSHSLTFKSSSWQLTPSIVSYMIHMIDIQPLFQLHINACNFLFLQVWR